MVYRRTYRRRTTRRRGYKRTYRKRFTRKYRYSKRGQKIFLYKRHTGIFGVIQAQASLETFGALNFSLNDLPNYTEFTNLYDMYKINCVKVTFWPQQTISNSLGSVNNPAGNARFFSAIDYNDGTQPTSVDELREYQSCKFTTVLKPHKRVIFKPKILDTSSYSISPWMSTASPSSNYFGLKYAIEAISSTNTPQMAYSVECKYYMSFKNVK